MNPEIIEEWYHVKFGKESPLDASKFSTPSEYLVASFGDTKYLGELTRYANVTKHNCSHWTKHLVTVLNFIHRVSKWLGPVHFIGGLLWQVLKRLKRF